MTESKAQKDERRQRQQQLNDICAVMDTPEGRRLIWRLLEKSHMFKTSYGGRTNDFIFNEGERNIGIFIFDEVIEANSELYLLMQKEQIDKAKEDQTDE